MKTILLFLMFIFSLHVLKLNAQTLNVVSEPGPLYDNATTGLPYFGYAGYPTAYNNSLYIYYDSVESDLEASSEASIFLAKYNGSGLSFFKNPDKGKGFVYRKPGSNSQAQIDQFKPVVFNGKLFLPYNDSTNIKVLAVFDGTSVKLAVNPDNSTYGYEGFAIVYNNNLYFVYATPNGTEQLATYDAASNSIKLITNPDFSPYGVQGDPIIFNNKLYLKYSVAGNNSPWHLASYDGIAWQIYNNPDASDAGYQGNETQIVWNDTLYAQYFDAQGRNRLLKFDGTNTPTLVPAPATDNSANQYVGYTGFPIIYKNNLYFQYANHSVQGNLNLAMYNGDSISIIPNFNASDHGFYNTPVIYDNQLCFFYNNASNVHQLAKYNGTTLSLVANPDNSPYGYWDYPIVYGNNLYFQYRDADQSNNSSVYQLGYYDNNAMHLITSPTSNTGVSTYNGWQPILFNNLLFTMYLDIQYGNFANLVYVTQSVLPVKFLGFSATLNNGNALLSWSTANEINNKGFNVERSNDGLHFNSIGFVNAQYGHSILDYSFIDNNILNGSDYYRLKQIDVDGNYMYSKIIKLDLSKFAWSINGNPVISNNSNIQLKLDHTATVSVQIVSLNGSVLQTIHKGTINAGNYTIPLSMNNVSAGMYIVKLMVDKQSYTSTIMKQ